MDRKWLQSGGPYNHRWVWANSDSLFKKLSCPKCNDQKHQILLKLFMQINFIWHSKDYTYTRTHINETWIFELGQLRYRGVGNDIYIHESSCNYIYIRSKYLNEILLNIYKELSIFTLCNNFFSFTNDFDSLGGRVMKFPACAIVVY